MGNAPNCCPVCKSNEWIIVDTANKGFSGGKAILGGILLGPIGLAAGAFGKKKENRYCRNCGFSHEYDV